MSNSIKVIARFRPQNRREIDVGGQPIVAFDTEDTCSLEVRRRAIIVKYANNCSRKRPPGPLPSTACLT